MKKIRVITGIITILGSLLLIALMIYYWEGSQEQPLNAAMIFYAICAIYYSIATLLSDSAWSQARKLKLGNRILQLKIEQKRLKSELGENETDAGENT